MSASITPESIRLSDLGLRFGSATDVGLKRATNEDSHLAASPVFLVADGMGGHEAGEIASALAVDAFLPLVGRATVSTDDVSLAFDRARASITALGHTGPRSAGTTVAGVAIAASDQNAYWLIFNLGDSRVYRFSDGELEQISVDHSVVQELVDGGELNRASAAAHPSRNVITRALGAGSHFRPDYWLVPIEPADRLLICSDGVSGELDDTAVSYILRTEYSAPAAARRLVREGTARGGRDNLTAIVVDAFDVTMDARSDVGLNTDPIPTDADGDDTIPRNAARAERS
ncbi:MAG: serine/threonine-protein phosphatase [Subtercola sp.]|nr:serine/threonine-protein phosphatase [Subtercola sp.]